MLWLLSEIRNAYIFRRRNLFYSGNLKEQGVMEKYCVSASCCVKALLIHIHFILNANLFTIDILLGIPVHIILPEDGPSRPKHVVISSHVSNKVHVHIVVLDGIISYLLKIKVKN
jgi:hypothetical protein